MPMDETTIKTNLGIILQAVLAKAIEQAGFTAIQDYQYDSTCERPDFLIPNQKKPRYMIEVHQTEARNSFQMKTLRAFTAVTESKAFYGDDLVTVNVLFGDPENELPASNVRALCGVFDANLVPRKDASDKTSVIKMEKAALAYASHEDYRNKNAKAAEEVISHHGKAIATLATMMKTTLTAAKARKELFPLWRLERTRVKTLGKLPVAGFPTYYKRQMLRAMYVEDADFKVMASDGPDNWPTRLKQQLVRLKLAEVKEEIDGDHFDVDPEFLKFVTDSKASELRRLCKAILDASPEMKYFFEDIRNASRRREMASHFIASYEAGKLRSSLKINLLEDIYQAFEHRRAWLIDCITRSLDISQNQLSRKIFTDGTNSGGFGDPVSHLAPKTARFRGLTDGEKSTYVEDLINAVDELKIELAVEEVDLDEKSIADKLLRLRLDGAMKLRKLDPLLLVVSDLCSDLGLGFSKATIDSAVGDLSASRSAGRFEVYIASSSQKSIILNAVAVHDSHGDDKSKEWGARRLATLYRVENGNVRQSELTEGLFILDGEWEDKDVARLYRCGWNHICRLGDLEDTLKKIFKIKHKTKDAKNKKRVLVLEGEEDDA